MLTGIWWGNLREGDHFEDLDVDGRTKLKWIFKKWNGGGAWTGLIWLRIGADGGSCECGTEPSGTTKCEGIS